MSYSFSDAEQSDPLRQTQMVPVIDLLNHHSYHHAELMFQKDYLLLTAIRNIEKVGLTITLDHLVHSHMTHKGEEIMNTYGRLDNASLVRMYGFAEHDNQNDTVSLYRWLSCTLHIG